MEELSNNTIMDDIEAVNQLCFPTVDYPIRIHVHCENKMICVNSCPIRDIFVCGPALEREKKGY